MERSAARLAAVQAIYQIATTNADHKKVVQDFLTGRLGGFAMDEDPDTKAETPVQLSSMDQSLFADLVAAVIDRQDDIDRMINESLSADWPKDRLEMIVRSILRTAVAEILSAADLPLKVTISEYVDVAHAFYSGPEPKMVNAVLDKIGHTLRDPDVSAP